MLHVNVHNSLQKVFELLKKNIAYFHNQWNSVNSSISICVSDLKDQKLPVYAIKTRIDDNRLKSLLARQSHKW